MGASGNAQLVLDLTLGLEALPELMARNLIPKQLLIEMNGLGNGFGRFLQKLKPKLIKADLSEICDGFRTSLGCGIKYGIPATRIRLEGMLAPCSIA